MSKVNQLRNIKRGRIEKEVTGRTPESETTGENITLKPNISKGPKPENIEKTKIKRSTEVMTVNLSSEIVKVLKTYCAVSDKRISHVVNEQLSKWIEKDKIIESTKRLMAEQMNDL